MFAEPEFNEAYLNNSYRDRWNDQRGERLVVDGSIFSQHVDPLRFSETRDLQHHRTWTHTQEKSQFDVSDPQFISNQLLLTFL